MHLKIAILTGILIAVVGAFLLFNGFADRFKGQPALPTPGPEASLLPQSSAKLMKGDTLNRTVTLYYVGLDDGGKNGEPIGCNDSLVPLSTNEPLKADPFEAVKQSLGMLFENKSQHPDESGIYNSLYQSDLSVDRIEKNGDDMNVYLKGSVSLDGICDTPRFQAQIKQTTVGNANFSGVEFYLNNEPLDDTLSQKGL